LKSGFKRRLSTSAYDTYGVVGTIEVNESNDFLKKIKANKSIDFNSLSITKNSNGYSITGKHDDVRDIWLMTESA